MRAVVCLFIAAAIVLTPGLAAAGDAGCVWRALPEGVRASVLKTYADDHMDALFDGIPPGVLEVAMSKCVATPKNAKAAGDRAETVGMALGSYAIQLGSEAALKKELQIEPTALERAYGGMDPKRRRELAQNLQSSRDPSKAAVRAMVDAMRAAVPDADWSAITDKPIFNELLVYFGARALREQAEAKF